MQLRSPSAGALGIADLAGFVDFLGFQANVGKTSFFRLGNSLAASPCANLTTILRCIILIRQPALRHSGD
ncbi:hypothetical protein [Blastomonas fulva]|uniref:hypothetical protein n=1 Tax=Blastomonas fulva TaxID=1550728 RepID=UPI003D2835D5